MKIPVGWHPGRACVGTAKIAVRLAPRARVVVCGQVALADRFEQPDIGPRFVRQIMIARATVQGFLVLDHADRFERARRRLAGWAKSGRLRHREDVPDGIEQMPRAFLRLLHGENFGKQLVRLVPDDG